MKRSNGPRKTVNLSKSLHRQLNSYALAASAAGVGVLGLTQFSDAEIIYTKAHEQIGIGSKYVLYLTHKGLADFTFLNTETCGRYTCTSSGYNTLVVSAAGRNAVGGPANALRRGNWVGEKR
jgi:hypothetical protein